MHHNEHKRHKMGQMPGDITRCTKIALLEGRRLVETGSKWAVGGLRHALAFQRMVIAKRKSQQRMRDKEMIRKGLAE